jgi:hypothetical protein
MARLPVCYVCAASALVVKEAAVAVVRRRNQKRIAVVIHAFFSYLPQDMAPVSWAQWQLWLLR